jgi:hypothetical protein
MRWTLVSGTPNSWAHCLTDFLGNSMNCIMISQRFHRYLNCEVFQIGSWWRFARFRQSQTYDVTLPLFPVWRWCSKYISATCQYLNHILRFPVALKTHLLLKRKLQWHRFLLSGITPPGGAHQY